MTTCSTQPPLTPAPALGAARNPPHPESTRRTHNANNKHRKTTFFYNVYKHNKNIIPDTRSPDATPSLFTQPGAPGEEKDVVTYS